MFSDEQRRAFRSVLSELERKVLANRYGNKRPPDTLDDYREGFDDGLDVAAATISQLKGLLCSKHVPPLPSSSPASFTN